MIKFITKLFGTESNEKARIEVQVETRQQTIDSAIKSVQKREITEQMVDMCYSEEELKQTKKAIAEYGVSLSKRKYKEALKKYPKALQF